MSWQSIHAIFSVYGLFVAEIHTFLGLPVKFFPFFIQIYEVFMKIHETEKIRSFLYETLGSLNIAIAFILYFFQHPRFVNSYGLSDFVCIPPFSLISCVFHSFS